MTSKIKVDPRTFKIIQPISQTSSETFTSDEESDTESSISVNSETESVKVIKLDSSEQSGGKNMSNIQLKSQSELKTKPQPQPPFQIQSKPQPPQSQPSQSQPQQSQPQQSQPQQSQPQQSQPQQSQSKSESTPPLQSELNKNFEKNLKNYLSIDNNNNESETLNGEESSNNLEIEDTEDTEETMNSQSTKSEKPKQVESTQDVFDLTQNKLYQVLSKLFEDENGKNISENITEMSKLFEKHNQIMEKMLNQLIIMNSNYKQVKAPEVVQTTTKTAVNAIDFRKEQRQEPRQEQRQEQRQETQRKT